MNITKLTVSVLRCCEQFVLDDSPETEMAHVGTHVMTQKACKMRKRIIRIENDDNLCCARDKATTKKYKKWERIQRMCRIQEQLATHLH